MHWVGLIIGFFFGSFLGITIMTILVAAGRAEENMEKYKEIEADYVKEFQI